MTKLSPEQRDAILQQPGSPVYVVDAETQQQYVILPAEVYQKVRSLFDEGATDLRETYAAQDAIARQEGWDDPAMDVYNDYQFPQSES